MGGMHEVRTGMVSVSELARQVQSAARASVRAAVGAGRGRFVLGIAGPPGAGKSTLSSALCDEINRQAASRLSEIAPMDGFHLRNAVLDTAGMRARKGESDTFDAAGYVGLLRLVRESRDEVAWPAYDRALHDPVPGGIVIGPEVGIVVTEGNYLLLSAEPWDQVRPLLDAAWYVDADIPSLRERLLKRHEHGGKSRLEAVEKVDASDLPNAHLVAESRGRADRALTATGAGYVIVERAEPRAGSVSIQARVPTDLHDAEAT